MYDKNGFFSEKKDQLNKIKKGKILKIKQGFNPNSSSMGSIVFSFPCAIFAVVVGFGVISGIITSFFIRKSAKNKPLNSTPGISEPRNTKSSEAE